MLCAQGAPLMSYLFSESESLQFLLIAIMEKHELLCVLSQISLSSFRLFNFFSQYPNVILLKGERDM